jgi:PAS domain S-box-containing protein
MQPHTIQTIEEARDQLAFAIDAAELATWDFDPQSGQFKGNTRFREWFGLDPEGDIDLQKIRESISEKDLERVSDASANALDYSTGGLFEVEYSITNTLTGQERVVRAKGKTLFDDEQVPRRFTGIIQDISSEVSVRDQRQKLLKLVENSVDLMSILDLNGTNSYINRAGREILGITEHADVTVMPIKDFHTPEQIAFVEAEIIPSVMSKGKWAGQFAIRHYRTGEIIPLYNNCHRIDDPYTGAPIGVGAVMRDMRPELNARNELEQKVRERTRELQDLNDELERKNKELASFAYVSSHDLQEPLRKISTFISRIDENGWGTDPESEKEYFDKIKISAARMQALINDLLRFSQLNTSEKEFSRRNLSELIREVLTDLSECIQKTNAVFEIHELAVLPVIDFQVRQLISNLVSNSIKFARTDVQPRIIISGKYVDGIDIESLGADAGSLYYQVKLEDNGIGFEPEYNERVFEVFQRLHGRSEYEGTGIGLAICKKIMDNHYGFIAAKGNPEKGAIFHIYFPAAVRKHATDQEK